MHLDQVYALGRDLMDTNGLQGWSLGWDRARRRAGQCNHTNRCITLSRYLMQLYDLPRVRDTILHEVAHALVGPSHGHDEVWRRKALELGCSAQRLVDKRAPKVPGDWVGTCPAGHQVERMRRPSRVLACGVCANSFSLANLLRWTYKGVPMEPSQIGGPYLRSYNQATLYLS